jgi:MFS family permease
LTEVGREGEFAELTGRINSALQFGAALSAGVGGVIAAIFGLRAAVLVSIVPQVIGVLVTLFVPAPRSHEVVESPFKHLREAVRLTLTNPKLRALNAGHIVRTAFGEAGFEFRGVFIQTLWPLWTIGWVRGGNNFGASLSYFFSGRLVRRFGALNIVTAVIPFSVFCHVLSLVLNNVISPLLTILPSVTYGVYRVSVSSLMQREFSPAHRATMGSVGALGVSLVFGLASLLIGGLADAFGIIVALLVMQAGQLCSVFFFRRAFEPSPTQT